MFKNIFLFTLRNIKRNKLYSFINIFGLAIGIAASFLILLWIQDELNFDTYHQNIDQLYQVVLNVEGEWWNSSNWALSPKLKLEYPEVEKASRYAVRNPYLSYKDKSFYESGAFVDKDFFEMFTYKFIHGNAQEAFVIKNSIILTRQTALKYFMDENPIGKVLNMNNSQDLTVTGIIADIPSNSTFQFSFLAPVQLFGDKRLNSWAVESQSFVQLKENTRVNQLTEKISGIVMKYDTRTKQEIKVHLHPFKNLHLYSLSGTGQILYVYLFACIAVLIIIIACINFINLATARARNRAKEIGIRKVAGASKENVIRQFYGESIILSFFALLVALALIRIFLPYFNLLSGKQIDFSIIMQPTNTAAVIIISLLTGIISGSYPALVISSFKPVNVLKISQNTGSTKSLFRKFLVISQFTAAIILIISTIVIYRQLDYIKNKDLGFNRNQIVIIPFYNSIQQNYASFKNELKQNPGIINITSATNIPTNVGNINPVYWEGQTTKNYRTINWVAIDYDYFDTFEMKILHGRPFSVDFPSDKYNYIVNEETAKLMGFESAVGKMFSIWENEGQIIGVVKNFHSRSLHQEIEPVVFTMDPRWNWSKAHIFVKLKQNNIQATLNHIKNTTKKFAPHDPFQYSFLDDQFINQYKGDIQIGSIFKYFSIVAIFVSCLGLFGLATFILNQRTKEIGVRRVLGASKSNIILLLSKDFFTLVFISNILAWPVAYMVMQKLLSSYVYHFNITVWIFIFTGLLTFILTSLTVGIQTLKTALANPVQSLRYE